MSINLIHRRGFIRRAAFAAGLFSVRGLFAEELMRRTASVEEGPFYPYNRLPLDTDNDLIIVNDSITPAVGEVTHLSGRLLTATGSPDRNATIEIWEVDHMGVYLADRGQQKKFDSNFQGFGRFLTGSGGEYYFRTIKPVAYPGRRAPHIHFKIKMKGREDWTTQLFIRGFAGNEEDGLWRHIGSDAEKASVSADFIPVPGSRIGEQSARFDIVLGSNGVTHSAGNVFTLLGPDPSSKARLGRVATSRGIIDTPIFMPVGTQASVKALDPRELVEIGTQILLGNTYHLNIRPGMEIIQAAGGLHRFMNWPGPILTDSGGFQVFSLAKIRKVREHGVEFRSHLDGSQLFIGPKESMGIQRLLGSDIAMAFDECPAHDCPPKMAEEAVQRTIRWARECREQPRAQGQLVFGIVQGGVNPELRERCARELTAMLFDGYAIGGVSVGEPEHEMMTAVELAEPFLPVNQPRYAMGLGTPAQMVELVARGVDMFDCVLPTRVARNGTAFTRRGTFNVKGGAVKSDFSPIDKDCSCYACRNFSRAYLRHLLNVNEILGLRMVSVHNSHFYLDVMREIRAHLAAGTFAEYRREFAATYIPTQKILASRLKRDLLKT